MVGQLAPARLRSRLAGRPDVVAVAATTLISGIVTLWWLASFRAGSALDIDENAYAGAAWDDAYAVTHHGLSGLWHAWLLHADFAPLVPLTALPIELVTGRAVVASMAFELVYLALLLASTAAITRQLVGPRAAAVAVVVVACSPAILDFQRTFHFVLASAALLTAAVAAMLASERFVRTGWAVSFVALLARMVLARTMNVAFVPGAFAAAALLAASSPDRRRSLRNLALSGGALVAIGATWFGPNWRPVLDYLTSYGYGRQSHFYGKTISPTSIEFWTRRAAQIIQGDLYLPLTILLVVTLLLAAAQMGRRRPSGPHRVEIAAVGTIVVAAYLALSSSPNQGFGFEAPLVPCIVSLAVAAIWHLDRHQVRSTMCTLLLATSSVTFVVKSDTVGFTSGTRSVTLPIFGRAIVIDDTGLIQSYVAGHGGGESDAGAMPALDEAWLGSSGGMAVALEDFAAARGRMPIVFFATRDPFFNTNTLGLASRFRLERTLPVGQLDPRVAGDNMLAYVERLSDPRYGQPNLVITGDQAARDFDPQVTQASAVAAVQSLGYTPAFTMVLPDGRHLQVWWLLRGPVR
ncbi:MAG: hypothetical protein QOE63_1303 [Acidimicrobiaceae bacterium]